MLAQVLIQTVDTFFTIYFWLIFIRVIASWIRPNNLSPWIVRALQVVYQLTEPVLAPIRSLMPEGMMLDFSPLIALFLMRIVHSVVVQLLWSILR